MKKIVIIAGAVLVLAGGGLWIEASRSTKGVQGASTTVGNLTYTGIQQDVAGGAKLYDVRTASEYASGHFAGATNWSLQDMQAGKLPEVAKDTKLYVYCRSGKRSKQAVAILTTAGYTNVTDLHGVNDVESLGGTLVAN